MAWKAEERDERELAEDALRQVLINYFGAGFTLKNCEDEATSCWRGHKKWQQKERLFSAMRGIGA